MSSKPGLVARVLLSVAVLCAPLPSAAQAAREPPGLIESQDSGGRLLALGLVGSTAGVLAGGAAGVALLTRQSTCDDLCGLFGFLLGAAAGSAVGSSVGVHLGGDGRGSLLVSLGATLALTSVLIATQSELILAIPLANPLLAVQVERSTSRSGRPSP